MGQDLAASNVNRSYALAATNIAIFTFMLFFLYPRFESGRVDPLLFQSTLVAMAVATFSLVFASLHYYRCSLAGRIGESERAAGRSETKAEDVDGRCSCRQRRECR